MAFPVVYYSPETRFGAGAAAALNFYTNRGDSVSPASQIQLGIAYTQNNQILFSLPFDLFFDQRKHQLSGELSYTDFNYMFYGIHEMQNIQERFDVRFPRFRLNYLRKLSSNIYAGPRWWYEKYNITKTADDGILRSGIIPGSEDNTTSGPGFVFLFDSRDNVYATGSGHYLELVFHNQNQVWGSDYNYNRYRFDYRLFNTFAKKHTVAFQLFGDFTSGKVPFNQLPLIGGAKRMRGFYEGRFRSGNLLLAQAEYRAKVYRRYGAVFFVNAATLGQNVGNMADGKVHAAAGAGLRYYFDTEKKIHVRLDAAFSNQRPAFYFTIGEAF